MGGAWPVDGIWSCLAGLDFFMTDMGCLIWQRTGSLFSGNILQSAQDGLQIKMGRDVKPCHQEEGPLIVTGSSTNCYPSRALVANAAPQPRPVLKSGRVLPMPPRFPVLFLFKFFLGRVEHGLALSHSYIPHPGLEEVLLYEDFEIK